MKPESIKLQVLFMVTLSFKCFDKKIYDKDFKT